MSRSRFGDLKSIVRQLNAKEYRVCEQFIVAFDTLPKESNRGVELIRLLRKSTEASYQEVKSELYANSDARTFDRLIARTLAKVLESCILDVNITRSGAYSDWYVKMLTVRKQFMAAFTLMGKGLGEISLRMYDRMIAIAAEYELYDELIELVHWKKNDQGILSGVESFDKYVLLYEDAKRKRDAVYRARDLYYIHYVVHAGFNAGHRRNISSINSAVEELTVLNRNCSSDHVRYYLLLLTAELWVDKRRFDKACHTIMDLIHLIKHSKPLFMPRRMAIAYSDLSEYLIRDYRFNDALKYIAESTIHRGAGEFNQSRDLENSFLAYIHSGLTDEALSVAEELVNSTDNAYRYHACVRQLMLATAHFVRHDYKACLAVLSAIRFANVDRDGCGFGVRVLTILALIERELFDQSDSAIEALRKYVSNSSSDSTFHPRNVKTLQSLVEIRRRSYRFSRFELYDFGVEKWSRDAGEWRTHSNEIVVFPEWVRSKIKGIEYVHINAVRSVLQYEKNLYEDDRVTYL